MDKDQLYRYMERELEGSASPEELNALREWYQSAADKEVGWEETDDRSLDQLKMEIWNNIKAAGRQQRRYPLLFLRWAAVLAGVFAGAAYLYQHPLSGRNHNGLLSIKCPPGQVKRLVLPDGTQVWLNGNSSLSFDSLTYGSTSRDLSLSGEAFFDVTHSAGYPFTVSTRHIHIRVLGTAFNVRDRPGASEAAASVIRGKIELRLNQERPGQSIQIAPGEKFAWRTNEAAGPADSIKKEIAVKVDKIVPLHVGERLYLPDTAWKQGEVVFEDLELRNIAGQLEQKYGLRIKILTPSVAAYRYTGIVKEETIGQVLEGLSLIRPFKYTLSAGRVEIR